MSRIKKIFEEDNFDPVVEMVGIYKEVQEFLSEIKGIHVYSPEENLMKQNLIKDHMKQQQKTLKDLEDLRQKEEEWEVKKGMLLPNRDDGEKQPVLLSPEMLKLKQAKYVRDEAKKILESRQNQNKIIDIKVNE